MADIFVPPEWAPRKALWTAWPSDPGLWGADMHTARAEVAVMVRALCGQTGEERVRILAAGDEAIASAEAVLGPVAEVAPLAFGDIWLRDTGPIFARKGDKPVALGFRFNGWGGKYELEGDEMVAAAVAAKAHTPLIAHDFVLEGGAVEMDGEGTLLTTRQCLLNHNRNPSWSERDAERALTESLGVERILWLDEGLANDHTDGHIDNLVRFAAPGIVVCQSPVADDPNAEVLEEIALTLAAMRDARGRRLEVIRVPSPGRVLSADGAVMPASHMNFVLGCGTLAVPVYANASEELSSAFSEVTKTMPRTADEPGPTVAFASAKALLTGGGAFHCITQQEPS